MRKKSRTSSNDFGKLSRASCETGILAAGGFGTRLGLAGAFANYAEIVSSEAAATISGNSAASISCSSALSSLSCSSTEVTTAYNPAASDPFSQASAIVPVGVANSCASTFVNEHLRYVAKNGNDGNDGSKAAPWLTIQHAVNSTGAGDTVVVGDGVYQETVKFKVSGTAAAPITLRSENKWRAKIAPTDTSANGDYVVWLASLSYITVQDFEITGVSSSKAGVQIDHGDHNSVLGNEFHSIGNNGTGCMRTVAVEAASDYAVVAGNRIHNIGSALGLPGFCNQQHGISTYKGNGGIVQNNLIFELPHGFALHFDVYGSSGWRVSNNTVVNVGHPTANSGGDFAFWCESGTCDNNIFNNNIFANTFGGQCFGEHAVSGTFGATNKYQNNLLHNCGTNQMVNGVVENTISADPLFVNATGTLTGDYHLQTPSPARNAGTASGAAATDFDGSSRPMGLKVDIGALEFLE